MDKKAISKFESETFALQVIARGSFIDDAPDYETPFMIEAITVRLNHAALNGWLLSEMSNTRGCYEDGPEGDAQFKAHKAEWADRRTTWSAQLLDLLDIDPASSGVTIARAQTEVFTVVYIHKVNKRISGSEAG